MEDVEGEWVVDAGGVYFDDGAGREEGVECWAFGWE